MLFSLRVVRTMYGAAFAAFGMHIFISPAKAAYFTMSHLQSLLTQNDDDEYTYHFRYDVDDMNRYDI